MLHEPGLMKFTQPTFCEYLLQVCISQISVPFQLEQHCQPHFTPHDPPVLRRLGGRRLPCQGRQSRIPGGLIFGNGWSKSPISVIIRPGGPRSGGGGVRGDQEGEALRLRLLRQERRRRHVRPQRPLLPPLPGDELIDAPQVA